MRGNTEQRQGALDKRPGPDSRRIECWTVDEVVDWLRRIGLQKYQGTFRANRINGELLLELNEKQLEKLLMNDPIHRLRFSLALKDERERRSEKTGYIINGTKNADKALTFLKD